ncbi:MAG: DUF1176 domain-containing protein [Sphingosinicella sp.]|nr:DUF1176 domain-containing protein [Sphingosinicella sp.]
MDTEKIQLELRRDRPECDSEDSPTIEPLDDRHSLILLTCWAGIKNAKVAVYVARRTSRGINLGPASFDYFPEQATGELVFINNPEFSDGHLSQTFGGSGASDPHTYGPILDYIWDGARFRLLGLTEASSDLSQGYHDEIVTWRAEVLPVEARPSDAQEWPPGDQGRLLSRQPERTQLFDQKIDKNADLR